MMSLLIATTAVFLFYALANYENNDEDDLT